MGMAGYLFARDWIVSANYRPLWNATFCTARLVKASSWQDLSIFNERAVVDREGSEHR